MSIVLATGGYDHRIKYWDATSGSCTKSIPFGDSQINCIEITADKIILAAGGNPLIQFFDVNSNDDRPVLTCDGHTSNVTAIGFRRDHKWLYSCSEDGFVKVWDPRTNISSLKYDCGSPVNTVVLHPNQCELISGDQNGFLKVWDLVADKCREELMPALDIPIRSISMV
jgi:G protein beta subunit-like protein